MEFEHIGAARAHDDATAAARMPVLVQELEKVLNPSSTVIPREQEGTEQWTKTFVCSFGSETVFPARGGVAGASCMADEKFP